MLPTWGTATFINPATLFAAGEQGAWYDPSDNTTMFQDAAGTTPVTAVEQAVGRILDKSGRGNHATQSTSASRPTLRARYNLLTYSEDQSNAAWTNYSATQVSNVATAPDGTLTADRIVEVAGSSLQARYVAIASQLNVPVTASIYAKASERNFINVSVSGVVTANWFAATFNVANGTVTQTGAGASGTYISSSITSVGDGWYRCVVTGQVGQASTNYLYAGPSNTGTPTYGNFGVSTYFGDTANGILVWGAQLTNPAVFPSNVYQRIAAATDYATGAAFPQYLSFDGTDDSLLTASVDFTGTDKMTVFTGLSKLSDAAAAVLIELSSGTPNDRFAIRAPNSAAANYSFVSGGTAVSTASSSNTFAAPITNVLTGSGEIQTDICVLRVNAAQAATSATDQGTGNYGTYPLFIGRRNNASLPFNGRIYSLIVRGAASNTTQVAQTERYVASKTPLGVVP